MRNLLVVENDPITLRTLAGMLGSHSNFIKIISGGVISIAIEILASLFSNFSSKNLLPVTL